MYDTEIRIQSSKIGATEASLAWPGHEQNKPSQAKRIGFSVSTLPLSTYLDVFKAISSIETHLKII